MFRFVCAGAKIRSGEILKFQFLIPAFQGLLHSGSKKSQWCFLLIYFAVLSLGKSSHTMKWSSGALWEKELWSSLGKELWSSLGKIISLFITKTRLFKYIEKFTTKIGKFSNKKS